MEGTYAPQKWADVSMLTPEEVNIVRHALLADKDSAAYRTIERRIVEQAEEREAERKVQPVHYVNPYLPPEQKDILRDLFPEFTLKFKNDVAQTHNFAAAMRPLELAVCMRKLKTMDRAKVIDIGGNWATHVSHGRTNFHSCCPVLDIRDSARETARLLNIEILEHKYETEPRSIREGQRKALELLKRDRNAVYCSNKFQDCDVKARVGVAIHSIYDMDIADMARGMIRHGMVTVVGSFIFHASMLMADWGRIDHLDCVWEKARFEGREVIRFGFENDASAGYQHDSEKYFSWVRSTLLEVDGYRFFYELQEYRAGIQFFSLTAVSHRRIPDSYSFKRVWFRDMKNKVVVRTFSYNLRNEEVYQRDLDVAYIVVSRDFVDKLCEYAYSVDDKDLSKATVFNYAKSMNNRLVVNGVSVTQPAKISADELEALAIVVYLKAAFRRYYQGQIIDRVTRNEMDRRVLTRGGLFNLIATWFKSAPLAFEMDFVSLRKYLMGKLEIEKYALDFVTAPLFETFESYSRSFFKTRKLIVPDGEVLRVYDEPTTEGKRILLEEVMTNKNAAVYFGASDDESSGDESNASSSSSSSSSDNPPPSGGGSDSGGDDSDNVIARSTSSGGSDANLTRGTRKSGAQRRKERAIKREEKSKALERVMNTLEKKILRKTKRVDSRAKLGMKIPMFVETVDEGVRELKSLRMDNYVDYLKQEYENHLSTSVFNYDNILRGGEINSRALRTANAVDDTDILVRKGDYYVASSSATQDYDVACDGEKFVDLRREEEDGREVWYADSEKKFLLVSKNTRLMQSQKKFEVVKDLKPNVRVDVTLIEGVPGCGKTYEIVHAVPNSGKYLVLTVGRETALDIKERLQALGKDKVTARTVDSFFLNDRKRYDYVYLDEGLMIHPGEIDAICAKSECGEMYVYGDSKQVPFISRVPSFELFEESYSGFARTEFRTTSRRCPQDVAAALSDAYPNGFFTTSEVEKSMSAKFFRNKAEFKPLDGSQVLAWTQGDKAELKRWGYPALTIHEAQGKTWKKVTLVRLNTHKINLFSSPPHALVAISRHTEEFVYMSKASSASDRVFDLLAKKTLYEDLVKAQGASALDESIERLRPVASVPDFRSARKNAPSRAVAML